VTRESRPSGRAVLHVLLLRSRSTALENRLYAVMLLRSETHRVTYELQLIRYRCHNINLTFRSQLQQRGLEPTSTFLQSVL
jgi:hypothetical protein